MSGICRVRNRQIFELGPKSERRRKGEREREREREREAEVCQGRVGIKNEKRCHLYSLCKISSIKSHAPEFCKRAMNSFPAMDCSAISKTEVPSARPVSRQLIFAAPRNRCRLPSPTSSGRSSSERSLVTSGQAGPNYSHSYRPPLVKKRRVPHFALSVSRPTSRTSGPAFAKSAQNHSRPLILSRIEETGFARRPARAFPSFCSSSAAAGEREEIRFNCSADLLSRN